VFTKSKSVLAIVESTPLASTLGETKGYGDDASRNRDMYEGRPEIDLRVSLRRMRCRGEQRASLRNPWHDREVGVVEAREN
jgi:hypothetical protein